MSSLYVWFLVHDSTYIWQICKATKKPVNIYKYNVCYIYMYATMATGNSLMAEVTVLVWFWYILISNCKGLLCFLVVVFFAVCALVFAVACPSVCVLSVSCLL